MAGCLGGGDGEAGRERWFEVVSAEIPELAGDLKNFVPRARSSGALGEMKAERRRFVHPEPAAVLTTRSLLYPTAV